MKTELTRIAKHIDDVHRLSDGELVDAVMEHVWASLSMRTREGWLLGELLGRFQQKAGIEETPAGITLDGQPFWPDVVGEEKENR